MESNKNLILGILSDQQRNENCYREKNTMVNHQNIIYNNKNRNNVSIKTTEHSSESEELISKNKFCSYLKQYCINNKKKGNIKNCKKFKINLEDRKLDNYQNKNIINNKINKKAQKFEVYNSEYPIKKDPNIRASKLLFNYKYDFIIDNYTNQGKIGDKKYIKNIGNDKYNKNDEYKKISIIPNNMLSHLCISKNIFINKNEKNYKKISCTQRYKHKFLTIIYLAPK